MTNNQFNRFAEVCERHGVSLWQFHEAPVEYRSRFHVAGDEECLLYLPARLLDDGECDNEEELLYFLDWLPKSEDHVKYAGDEWGWSRLVVLADGSRIAVTEGSLPVIQAT